MIRSLLIYFLGFCSLVSFGQVFDVEKIEFSFDTYKWTKVNSDFSDFGAVLYNNQVVFCTERNIDQVLLGENNWKKGKHYNIISFELSGDTILTAELTKAKLFSEKFTSNSHTGPLSFSETKDTIFFSRVEKSKLKGKKGKFHFKPQMYMCVWKKNNWGKLTKLAFNERGYSFSHPCYDSKNQELYFASDRPGGFGESDIYCAKLDSTGEFSIVVNLGDQVNTNSKEMFPFFYKGDLFFSSARNGGLDIYWSYHKKDAWQKPELLGEDLNSKEDDFSMYIYANHTRGFMASNKYGNDDIFYFDMEKKVTIKSELVGEFSYRNLDNDLSNIEVQLISDDIDLVFETVSDDKGKFQLRELPSGEKYSINIINNNEDYLYVTFYDDEENVLSKMVINGKGNFEYRELEGDNSLLTLIESDDDFDMNSDFNGKIITSDHSIPDKNLEILLVDRNGEVIQRTQTDHFGNFQLKEIDYQSNNRLKIENPDDDYTMFVFNDKGEIIANLRIDENGVFAFRKLQNEASELEIIPIDQEEFSFVSAYFLGELIDKNQHKITNDSVYLEVYDRKKELITKTWINKKDNFMLDELPLDDIYLFKSNYNEDPLVLNLYNHEGELVAKLIRDSKTGFFLYRKLKNDSSNIEIVHYNEDSNFNFNENNSNNNQHNNGGQEDNNNGNVNASNFTGNEKNIIYFDVNSSYMTPKEKEKLNQLISELKSVPGTILIEGHADINGDNGYNKWLSERRSRRVMNFLVSMGIPKAKISLAFFGEEKPDKVCSDGNCSEEQVHKFNRRVSLKYPN